MRIDNPYIKAQPEPSTSGFSESTAAKAARQLKVQQARDSYNKNNAAGQIIEAEYVDLYNQENKALQQKNNAPLLHLKTEIAPSKQATTTATTINSNINKYQIKPMDVPRPGSYLNIYA